MSKEALAKVVQRSISDAAFRRQLATDPTGALRGYDLTSDEKSALRSGQASRLSAFGVDQRMSKAFTLGDPSSMGASVDSSVTSDLSAGTGSGSVNEVVTAGDGAQATGVDTTADGASGQAIIPSDPMRPDFAVTGGSEPRDTAPVWIGEYSGNVTGAVQSPDAADRNLIASDATGGVQSPDALDRNLLGSDATGGVQSPDAADRNLAAFAGSSSEPRDVAPTFIGEYAGDATGGVQSPDAADRNLLASDAGTSSEPRDVAPTWIGDNQSLSSVMPSDAGAASGAGTVDAASQDEGFIPSVGYASDSALTDDHAGGASNTTDTGDTNIQP